MVKVFKNSICSKCRRAGEKLFLKGEKCFSPKCALIKRNYTPGMHGLDKKPGHLTSYGEQLKEKQKAKRTYGLRETQFSNYINKASQESGNTTESLIRFLEMRLDNVVYRLGLAKSRRMGRQIVSHAHVLVNGKKVNIPSFQVKPNQVISLSEKALERKKIFENILPTLGKREVPVWLVLEADKVAKKINGKVLGYPKLEDVTLEFDPKKIIEFYSR